MSAYVIPNINEVCTSYSGALEGRVVAEGHSFKVETRVVGKPYGWQFQGRWMDGEVACNELEAILNAN